MPWLLSGIVKNTSTMGMMQCELPFMWTCCCACVFVYGYNPWRVWLRTSLLIGTDSVRPITPPRCSWDHAGLCSVCQTTRRWRSCVQGEAAACRYLWLFVPQWDGKISWRDWSRDLMILHVVEVSVSVLKSAARGPCRHPLVSLAHLQKMIDKYFESLTISRQ